MVECHCGFFAFKERRERANLLLQQISFAYNADTPGI